MDLCPLCSCPIRSYRINFDETFPMCSSVTCPYPFKHATKNSSGRPSVSAEKTFKEPYPRRPKSKEEKKEPKKQVISKENFDTFDVEAFLNSEFPVENDFKDIQMSDIEKDLLMEI